MEDLLKKESVKRVLKVLNNFDQSIKVENLDTSARTAKDAAESLKTEIGSIIKSLLLRRQSSFLLCLVAGDKRCSLNKIKKLLNEKDVCMAPNGATFKRDNAGFLPRLLDKMYQDRVVYKDKMMKAKKLYQRQMQPHLFYSFRKFRYC